MNKTNYYRQHRGRSYSISWQERWYYLTENWPDIPNTRRKSVADKGAEYRAKGKVHDMRRVKKATAAAAEKKRKKSLRSRVGAALEKASITDTGKRVARAIGGNPEPAKKAKKRGSKGGFGGPMSIPSAGGSTERVHGSGYDKTTSKKRKKA